VTPPIPGGDPFAQKCDQARLLARSNLIKDFNGMDLLSRMDRTIQRLTPDEMNRMKAAFTTLGSPASSADQKKAAQADVRSAMKGAFQRDSLTTVGDLFADIRMGSNGSDQTYQGVYVGGAVFAGVSRELRGPNLDILKMNWVPGLNWVTLSLSNYKVARDWKLLDSSGAPKQDLPSGGTSLKVSQYIEQKTLSGNCAGRTEMTAAQQQDFDRLALPSPL
jgi:hypothetical protein